MPTLSPVGWLWVILPISVLTSTRLFSLSGCQYLIPTHMALAAAPNPDPGHKHIQTHICLYTVLQLCWTQHWTICKISTSLSRWRVCARQAGSCEVWGGHSPPLWQVQGPCPGETPWLQHRDAPAPGTGPPDTSNLDTHTHTYTQWLRVIHDWHAMQDEWCFSGLSLASACHTTD